MTTEQFRELWKATPFRPFAIHLADGRALTVRHPEMAAPSRGGRTIVVHNEEQVFEVVDLLLVVSLRLLRNGGADAGQGGGGGDGGESGEYAIQEPR
jgi:hypothetical protein